MLARQVDVKHAIGTSAYRRRCARVTAQVTLWRIVLAGSVLAVLGVFVLELASPMCSGAHDQTRARQIVEVYAFEAYPQWTLTNHEQSCPATIHELTVFAHHEPIDPWGTPLEMRCPHARSFYVRSAGPDQTFDTTDDISSQER